MPPPVAVAVNANEVPLQIDVCGELIEIVGVTDGVTDIVRLFEATLAGVAQTALLVKRQLTILPFTKLFVMNVLVDVELTPLPLILQRYCGDEPAFVAVAVKVTGTPAHTFKEDVARLTVGVTGEFNVI